MKNRRLTSSAIALLSTILILCGSAKAQTPVALAPSVHPQFLTTTGQVLAGGFVYTYQAGTTTRLDTYTDSTGSSINAWPIPLDATGAPSNGSTQTGIWLSNQAYKFCAYNSAMILQWCTDNVSAYQTFNNIQNITFGSVTSDPTGAAGETGYRSDIPCFRFYTTFWDCGVLLTGIQTLTNKTFDVSVNTLKNSTNTAGHYLRNNGTQYVDSTIQAADVSRTVAIPYIIDGGGIAITTGTKGYVEIPFNCTVIGWTALGDQTGSIVVDVKRSTYAGFPTTASIAGSDKPTLSSVQKNQNLSLTQWTTAINAGDILEFNVNSATTVTRVTISLRATIP